MNIAGVGLAIALLVVLVYKRLNLIIASLIAVSVLAVTNDVSFSELATKYYASSLAGFIEKYFFVFITNALFGKIMEETLLATTFSGAIGKALGEKNAVFGAMLATALLSYGGISVFVIVFTVYPIFLATFKQADLPRKYIPACIMTSACTFSLSMLPGGAQLNNIIPAKYLGTSPMAAFSIGLLTSVFCIAFILVYFNFEFSKARKKGEHFTEDEVIHERMMRFKNDSGIKPFYSALPLILIVILINAFGLDLSVAVLCASVLALFIGRKNLVNKLDTINRGVGNVGKALVTTAAPVGVGGAVLSCSGAIIVLDAIAALPIKPIISLSMSSAFAGFLTGSGGGGCDVAINVLSKHYLAVGIEPEILHRIVAMATAAFSCLPHNGMIITLLDTCGFTVSQAYKYIFVSTVVSGIVCLMIANVLGGVLY